jgi:nucleoside-diphosphate-sugar epimerase
MSTILITGGTGCIGSVTVCKLLQSSDAERIIIASRSDNARILKLWTGEKLDPAIKFTTLDLSDYEAVLETTLRVNPTHIIHLGGLQSPDCAANHLRGMEINVGGTIALLDAAERLSNLKRFVFASSGAVYGKRAVYAEATVPETVRPEPPNHYGTWKLAGEHLARFMHERTGVPVVCLRLNTTYGQGRDKGLTAAPTAAIKAVALGAAHNRKIRFEMPYCGLENYHYVEDVGEHFAACAMRDFEGYGVFNIKGQTLDVRDFLDAVVAEAQKLGWGDCADIAIAGDAKPNMFIHDLDHRAIDSAFDSLPLTCISEGVRRSLLAFRKQADDGVLFSI